MARLIDADALIKEIETLRSKNPSFMDQISDYAIFVMKSAVSFAPTVRGDNPSQWIPVTERLPEE